MNLKNSSLLKEHHSQCIQKIQLTVLNSIPLNFVEDRRCMHVEELKR